MFYKAFTPYRSYCRPTTGPKGRPTHWRLDWERLDWESLHTLSLRLVDNPSNQQTNRPDVNRQYITTNEQAGGTLINQKANT
jgi:hypothetical protein